MRKSQETVLTTARKPRKLPDYFFLEEASALVVDASSYEVRMAMRIMLRTGGPPAQPGFSDPRPEAGRAGQQGEAGAGAQAPLTISGNLLERFVKTP